MKKFISVIIIFILFLSTITLVGNIWGSYKKVKSVDKIREKEKELSGQTRQLREKLKESQSEEFIEEESRNKLGLSKKGESIYVVEQEPTEEASEKRETQNVPNWKKWVNVFKD